MTVSDPQKCSDLAEGVVCTDPAARDEEGNLTYVQQLEALPAKSGSKTAAMLRSLLLHGANPNATG